MINLFNTEDITSYLSSFSEDCDHADLLSQYLILALEKPLRKDREYLEVFDQRPNPMPDWMIKDWGKKEFHRFSPSPHLDQKISHIRDWILGSIVQGASWIEHQDEDGRPLKLKKIGSVAQAMKEADKAIDRQNQMYAQDGMQSVSFQYELDHDDVAIVQEFNDGYCWVKILTFVAAAREAFFMQHCVGNGAYEHYFDEGISNLTTSIYSLRDASNKPHVTMQVDDKSLKVRQCVGKQNKPPLSKYAERIISFIELFEIDQTDFVDRNGFVFHNGEVVELNNLPDDFVIEGDLYIKNRPDFVCPKNLTITGDFYLDTLQRPLVRKCIQVGGLITEDHQVCADTIKRISYAPDWKRIVFIQWYKKFGDVHELHREDGPAYLWFSEKHPFVRRETWSLAGHKHRLDGPAHISYSSFSGRLHCAEWYQDGKRHRKGEPAYIEWSNKDHSVSKELWYENGRLVSEKSA